MDTKEYVDCVESRRILEQRIEDLNKQLEEKDVLLKRLEKKLGKLKHGKGNKNAKI